MNEDRIRHFLKSFASASPDQLRRKEYFSNSDKDRQIYELGSEVLVKAYGSSSLGAFDIECKFSEAIQNVDIDTPRMIACAKFDEEAYIAFEKSTSETLSEVYQGLFADQYGEMLSSLAAAVSKLHAASVLETEIISDVNASPNSRSESIRRIEEYEQTLSVLYSKGFISNESRKSLKNFISDVSSRAFSSKQCVTHLDLHNENVLYALNEGNSRLQILDWECVSYTHGELDLVHPFLNILGECFMGRRFKKEDSQFRVAFENGYRTQIDWEVISLHAALWYFECFLEELESNPSEPNDFFLKTAVGALLFSGGPFVEVK